MDILCSEYGWTVSTVFDHTKEQIEVLTKAISKRRNENIKFTASIHGAELKNSGGDNTLDLGSDIDKLGSIGVNVVKE